MLRRIVQELGAPVQVQQMARSSFASSTICCVRFSSAKTTDLPNYLVLISTLGGIAIFGLNGFVIGPVVAALFIAVWDLSSASRQIPQSN